MGKELKIRGFSPGTSKTYLSHLRRFLASLDIDPLEVSDSIIRDYLLRAIQEDKGSHAYVSVTVHSSSLNKLIFDQYLT